MGCAPNVVKCTQLPGVSTPHLTNQVCFDLIKFKFKYAGYIVYILYLWEYFVGRTNWCAGWVPSLREVRPEFEPSCVPNNFIKFLVRISRLIRRFLKTRAQSALTRALTHPIVQSCAATCRWRCQLCCHVVPACQLYCHVINTDLNIIFLRKFTKIYPTRNMVIFILILHDFSSTIQWWYFRDHPVTVSNDVLSGIIPAFCRKSQKFKKTLS